MRTMGLDTGGYITGVRILILTTWYPTVEDPVRAVFVRRHAEAIAQRHDVSLVVVTTRDAVPWPSDMARLTVDSRTVRNSRPGDAVVAAREVRRMVQQRRVDIIHTMGFSSLLYGAMSRTGVPWVHTEHWSGVTEPRSVGRIWYAARVARHLLRLPQAVTVVSTEMRQAVQRFARSGAVAVVGNCVEVPSTVPVRADTDELRLLAVGGLNAVKDPRMAVQTISVLRDRGVRATLRWAGRGPLIEAATREAVRLGVHDEVRLLGQVPPDELAAQYEWCTEYFLPTRHETFCVSAAEALAHGRPVVLGANGGQRDFVDRTVGALVADRSPTAFASALQDVRARLGRTPAEVFAERIRERYSPEAVGARFDEVYSNALASRIHHIKRLGVRPGE
jgi:glycosyltransferase involved in cell wall biosynthesis